MDQNSSSDTTVLDLLRKRDSMTVAEFAAALGVTATAVRQRLNRLLAQGDVERMTVGTAGRGRPSHRYRLTDQGRHRAGANFGDLAMALWQEIRAIQDPGIRRGLLQRVSSRLATQYAQQTSSGDLQQRMQAVARLFGERQIPFEVEADEDGLPVLHALACPYPELAEQDRSVCAMERLLFSELLGARVSLGACRLDGDTCCSFRAHG